jgi:2'-5' RNA ligase
MPDLDYAAYLEHSAAMLLERLTEEASHRYEVFWSGPGQARVRASSHPGIAVLAEPCPVAEAEVRRGLEAVQAGLVRVPGFIPVPPESFHLALAPLLSGPEFEGAARAQLAALHEGLAGVFARREARTLKGRIIGFGTLPGSVVAVVTFSEEDYGFITRLRSEIYTALERQVERPQGAFQGHITLGCMVSPPGDHLERGLRPYRSLYGGWEFGIRGAGLYSFADLSAYCPVGPRLPRLG